MKKEDWLKFLGLGPNAKLPDIKRAWKQRAKETHPDVGGDKDEFMEVTHAYKMLTDESYQRNQSNQRAERAKQDLTINMKVHMEWKDAFFGRPVTISWNIVEMGPQEFSQPLKTSGHQEIHTETIIIPPGFFGGSYVVENKGLKKGSIQGNCNIQIIIIKDDRYESIKDLDIGCDQQVPLDLLIKGGTIDVETPWGPRKLTVKPGTQPGSKISIKKAGVNKAGSLSVALIPRFPGEEELKSEAYKGMKIEWDIVDENENDSLSPEEAEILKQFVDFTRGNK